MGRCIRCNEPSLTPYCPICKPTVRTTTRIYAIRVRKWRNENNICSRCGKNQTEIGYLTCTVCLEYVRQHRKKKKSLVD